jgi:thymidylate synthase ThyX
MNQRGAVGGLALLEQYMLNSFAHESFTATEQGLLQPFVTNLDRSVFGLRNLPEVVKGALFSRYSRSEKSLRQILLSEFITAPESGFDSLIGSHQTPHTDQSVATQKAEAFYDRVLIGYGDDSVAELGGAHLACESISNIAAKALEDSRLGISPLEKSTRYLPFNKKINGRYRYYREPTIMASSHAVLYEATLDQLFDTYSSLVTPLLSWVQRVTPRDKNTSERAYRSATRAKTFDLLRGLLPMATLTNVGLFGNGRAFEYLLVKLSASDHAEVQELGLAMNQELQQTIPSFVKRAYSNRGQQYAQYLAQNVQQTQQITQQLLGQVVPAPAAPVQLIEYDPAAESKVIAAMLYPQSDLSYAQVQAQVSQLTPSEKLEIIGAYIGDRQSRFHRPGRALEETYYTFDILADLGAYRDLHRHRIMTQERQRYTVRHGYIVPPELAAAGLTTAYCQALEQTAQATEIIGQDLPAAAQYLVPFAYRTRWRIKLNLREAYHLIELRSARQGHPSYRRVAQAMYRQIQAVHPTLVANMSFVDLDDYVLERLSAEQRLDQKLQQQN